MDKMETTKQFDNITWADLAIINDVLKTVHEHYVKLLKYKDLWTVWSQLKVRGVKNVTKEQMIRKLVSIHQFKTRYNKTVRMYQQTRSPSALMDFSTFCFQTHLLKAFLNVGM